MNTNLEENVKRITCAQRPVLALACYQSVYSGGCRVVLIDRSATAA